MNVIYCFGGFGISRNTDTKSTKVVKYIHDNKSWERCYVILKIIFPCLRVLRLADSNLAGMEKSLLLLENDQAVN